MTQHNQHNHRRDHSTSVARITRVKLKNFKSYGPEGIDVPIHPVTLLVGRNNSGKSSIIQALLLLKQTLEQARGNEVLVFHGSVPVPASSLSELTHGWPESEDYDGPTITVEWDSNVDFSEVVRKAGNPNLDIFSKHSNIDWITDRPQAVVLSTSLELKFAVRSGRVCLLHAILTSTRLDGPNPQHNPTLTIKPKENEGNEVLWGDQRTLGKLIVEWDHFLPYVSVDTRNVGPRHSDRSRANGFRLLYDQPLAELRELLLGLGYLSSERIAPQAVYQPIGGELSDVGYSGERAAQVLHFRKRDSFHYLPPVKWDSSEIPMVSDSVTENSLEASVQSIFEFLGVETEFTTEDIANIGFTVFFGKSSLIHVGRGISYLLPVVEIGLLGDPIVGQDVGGELSLKDYISRLPRTRQIAVEEPESHLHPAVHSRLAHFIVSTGMSGRQWLVETHSDHLIRRLRRLTAASPSGSKLETWLCSNVSITSVTQSGGRSFVNTSYLSASGEGSSKWPEEFMDQATREEDSIYLARLTKNPNVSEFATIEIEHRPHDEEDEYPQ